MPPQLRLVLALHNHQPVGNFEGVFEDAFCDSYLPFLDVLEEFPDVPIALHTSGSLLEWIEERHPEYVDRVRSFVDRGQIEILGGPYYEPILACIPQRDRVGQIRAYSQHLERLFGVAVRGMWVPERVWEQTFASDITEAGIEYTIVDDFHFRAAGVEQDRLYGYYFTEDEGRLLKIFPGSERLRYTIPFQDPHVTIDCLRDIAERFPNAVVAFGDDGEKFGTWPGTKDHVYRDGWLRRFLDALRANSDWIRVCTMAEAIDHVPPLGRVYLPDSSYREMTEWALPAEQQVLYYDLVHRHEHDEDWPALRQFVRGGFWRNFLAKYPESNEMYCRMREVSDRLVELAGRLPDMPRGDLLPEAREDLYRGQCNCPYWHGAFGGLYLPHLRNAIFRHLIAADTALEQAQGRTGRWVRLEIGDFNLDARREVRLASDQLIAYLAPARGGHLYELDVRSTHHNLLATLNRRREAYHEKVLQGANQQNGDGGQAVSIHDLIKFKQPDLDKKLLYDAWPRKSLVDHFLSPDVDHEAFERGEGEIGDFLMGVYETTLRESADQVEVEMSRTGRAGQVPLRLLKCVTLSRSAGSLLEVRYELSEMPPGARLRFGVEFNFAGLAAGADDRYFYGADGRQLGQLQSSLSLTDTGRIGLVDEWVGIDASLDVTRPADVWTFPIQTVSQSEGGFELVHQSSVVMPTWAIDVDASGRWDVEIQLSIDTSAADARRLVATTVVG